MPARPSSPASAAPLRRVCVFCGSSAGARPAYREAARATAGRLAERGIGLVYGGGRVGLMGELAEAALAKGGEVIGVIPRPLYTKELAHEGVSRLHVVETMHERKGLMADLADAFVALPGGVGTLDELFEVLTWSQLGLHAKPAGLLEVEGFFAGLEGFLDRLVEEGFLRREHRALLLRAEEPASLLDALAAFRPPPPAERWLERDEI